MDSVTSKGMEADMQRLIASRDLAYVSGKLQKERKQIAKLQKNLHFLDDTVEKVNKHTIFVDDEDELNNFSAAKHFETTEELAQRAYNRPRKETLRKMDVTGAISGKAMRKMRKKREAAYRELGDRLDREEKIATVAEHLQVRKNLEGKGRRKKVKDAEGNLPAVYMWKAERKR